MASSVVLKEATDAELLKDHPKTKPATLCDCASCASGCTTEGRGRETAGEASNTLGQTYLEPGSTPSLRARTL
jgi:hypothetical protein